MPEARTCLECGTVIPDGQPRGLCPRCALSGLLNPADDGSDALAPSPSSVGEVPSNNPDSPSRSPCEGGKGLEGRARETPGVGRHFGDYELLEEIARGGMGVVYKARQRSLDRFVAVKFLLFGPHASAEFIKRFRIEASAAAALQHPNIVAIHEVGVHEGEHFLVMDYVDGPNLAKLAREQPLPPKRAAQYLKTIAEAIHYAHEHGILHRDLKPSNVLIDSNDQPRVTDFGLAKRLGTDSQPSTQDVSQLTLSGQVMGSPGYMPPEQASGARGKMSRRSDVYSLGAMLYHVLTGRPPFGGGSAAETLRQVETQEPVSLRLLNPGVPFDLETICLKCLEKDPDRRYRTAGELSEEMSRFLSDEPIQARPPSRVYRFRKLVRRNKLAFASVVTVAAALIAGTFVSTLQALRARRAETLAEQRVIQVAAERDEKDKARQEAEDVSTFLAELFQSPEPKRGKGRTITVAETLDSAARKLDTDLPGQPARRARLQSTLGLTYHALGLDREAIPLFEKTRDYYLATLGKEHPDTLSAIHNLAMSYDDAGRRDEALKLQEEVLWLRRKAQGPEHSDTLRAMNNLANSYQAAGRRDEALKLRDEVLALRRKLSGLEHPETLRAMYNLALSYAEAGHREEAQKLTEEVLTLRRNSLGLEHPDTLTAMLNLALLHNEAGRWDKALQLGEEVLVLRQKVLGPEHPVTLLAMQNLATFYQDAGSWDKALKLREEVLVLSRKVLVPEHPHIFDAMYSLSVSYSEAGRRDEALKLREEVLAFRRNVFGPEHPKTFDAMAGVALSYDAAGRREEAIKLGEEVLALRRKVQGPEHVRTLMAMQNLANSYHYAARRDEALRLREEGLPLYRKVLGPEHPDTLTAMHHLALSYHNAGRHDEALKLKEQVLAGRRKVLGPEHPSTLTAFQDVANAYQFVGRREEALQAREEVLALRRKVLGLEHRATLGAMHNLAVSYEDAGRQEEALKLREDVLSLRRKVLGLEHLDTLVSVNSLADSYASAGRREEALKLREELLTLRRKVLGSQHLDTLEAMNNLAAAYEVERKYSEAESLYRQRLEGQTSRFPSTNDAVVGATAALASLLCQWAWSDRGAADKTMAVQHAREAERLLRDCLATRAKTLRPGSSRLAETRSRLGGALVTIAVLDSTLTAEARLAKLNEAEALLLESHEALRQKEAVEPAYKRDALEGLVRLYEAWGQADKRVEWQQKLDALKAGKQD